MNGAVHYGLTRRWALDEGFTEDEAVVIARADIGVDRAHPGSQLRNWSWHFWAGGASVRASHLARRASRERSLELLGEALHCLQDSIAHGLFGHLWHFDGIDIWERRSERVRRRIESRSRRMLARYRDADLPD